MTTANEQLAFLEELADDVQPIIYYDPDGERHRVVIQNLMQIAPLKREDRYEPVIQIAMLDVWPIMEVQRADAATVQTLVTASAYEHTSALWDGNSAWGFAQWG